MTITATPTQLLFGLTVNAMTLDQVLDRCREAIRTHSRLLIGVVNAAKVVNLGRDAQLRDSLLSCDLILADGQSVVWASKVLADPLPERVTGIDLFTALLGLADREGHSVYLLGATPEVIGVLVERVAERYPGVRVAGYRDGYFTDDEADAVARDIRDARPDMLFLGMVSPKKEIFLGTYGNALDVPVMHGVGGSFDILAGVTARAPASWQRLGLEWAYRLKQEPRRLWKRYLNTNTRFVLKVLTERRRPTPPLARPTNPLSDRNS